MEGVAAFEERGDLLPIDRRRVTGTDYHAAVMEESGVGVASKAESSGAEKPVLHVRWVSLGEASRLLNITEVAVRKQISARTLTGMRAGRGWRVLLPGEPQPSTNGTDGTRTTQQIAGDAKSLDVLAK